MTLTLVGDVDQMMYRFTGAAPEVMTEKIDPVLPDIETMFLSTNYRSTSRIVERCSTLITKNYSDEGGPYDQKFMKATQARPDANEGDELAFTMYDDVRAEAEGIAATILEQMSNHGYDYGDFYVGARTRAQLGYLEGALYRAGVKFVNITGGSFWQNYHVANIIGFLKLAADTTDDSAFQQVYNIASSQHTDRKGDYCHHHWFGREFLAVTNGSYSQMHLAIRKNRRYAYGVEDLTGFVQEVQAEIAYADSPVSPINFILENCYKDWLKAKGELIEEDADSNILDDIATILDVASQYNTVEEFLGYVKQMTEAAEEAKRGNLDEFTVLSTYHRLKGSERPVMICAGWGEGSAPDGTPKGLLPHSFALAPPPKFGVLSIGGMALIEDERSIAFVAVSRAKDKVFITAPGTYRSYNLGPSRFVYELGLIPGMDLEVAEVEPDEIWVDPEDAIDF